MVNTAVTSNGGMKVLNKVIEEALTEEEDITHQLGEWYDEGGHQQAEWHLNAREGTLYRCKVGKWERHEAKQRGRLRFENEGAIVGGPQGIRYKVQATIRSRVREISIFFYFVAFYFTAHNRNLRKVPWEFFKL
jgi:hypothetical protein